jgi:hypothetical protein
MCGYPYYPYYPYYGKTTRQRGPGHALKGFRYYRRSATDSYRFGG